MGEGILESLGESCDNRTSYDFSDFHIITIGKLRKLIIKNIKKHEIEEVHASGDQYQSVSYCPFTADIKKEVIDGIYHYHTQVLKETDVLSWMSNGKVLKETETLKYLVENKSRVLLSASKILDLEACVNGMIQFYVVEDETDFDEIPSSEDDNPSNSVKNSKKSAQSRSEHVDSPFSRQFVETIYETSHLSYLVIMKEPNDEVTWDYMKDGNHSHQITEETDDLKRILKVPIVASKDISYVKATEWFSKSLVIAKTDKVFVEQNHSRSFVGQKSH